MPKLVGINHIALEVGDIDEALAFWESIFGELELRGRMTGMAFIDMGDQFIALSRGRTQPRDDERHFGLVVDDKEAVRERLKELGVITSGRAVMSGTSLDFWDPWGNQIQVVDYRDIQFTKTDGVLGIMGLDRLEKSERAREELRAKGITQTVHPALPTALLLALAVPFIPNDPGFEANRSALDAMSVPQAWSLTRGDPVVVIAVIDSGVTPNADLFLTGASAPDSTGHGTAMAEIAGGKIDNGISSAGVCGNCRVLPIKIAGSTRDVSPAINSAVDQGADVIAVTGSGHYSGAFDAVTSALRHGVPVFLPAGDDNSDD